MSIISKAVFVCIGITGVGQSFAAAPVAFDQWAVNSGQVSASCPSGFSCSDAIDGLGFLQREIRELSSDKAYLQTIITSKDSSGQGGNVDFADESFVFKHGLTDSTLGVVGIADKQAIRHDGSVGNMTKTFDSTTSVSSGWAASSGNVVFNSNQHLIESQQFPDDFSATFDLKVYGDNNSEIDIWQAARDPGLSESNEFDNVFHYMDNKDASGSVKGSRLALSQNMGAGYPKLLTLEDERNDSIRIETGGPISNEERQVFLVRRSSGNMSTSSNPMWIYHWNSVGIDARKGKPLTGGWFGCRSSSFSDQCQDYSKHETLAMPSLPFDPLPFNAPVGHHNKDVDESLYPARTGGQQLNVNAPGLNAGGFVPPPPTPRELAPATQVAGGENLLLGWSASGGQISFNCPSGFSCRNAIVDDGFIQVTLTDLSTGENYFETIVTDRGASGSASSLAFSNQAVIKQLPLNEQTTFSGVANTMKVTDSSEYMFNTSTIRTGWARTNSSPDIEIDQQTSWTLFEFDANMDDAGNRTGLFLDLVQNASNPEQKLDEQIFIHTQVGGDMLTRSGGANLPGGYSTNWSAGDHVAVTFLTVGNDPSSSQGKEQTKKDTGNERQNWNQGWGGWRVSLMSFDNYSDNKHPTGIVTPKDTPAWTFWQNDPFGDLNSKINSAQAGGGLGGASSGKGGNSLGDGKGGSW